MQFCADLYRTNSPFIPRLTADKAQEYMDMIYQFTDWYIVLDTEEPVGIMAVDTNGHWLGNGASECLLFLQHGRRHYAHILVSDVLADLKAQGKEFMLAGSMFSIGNTDKLYGSLGFQKTGTIYFKEL